VRRVAELGSLNLSGPMLLEIAIADAYGAGFENAPERIIRQHNDLSAYISQPRHRIAAGSYTDDTQMSIAVAEAILSGDRWTPSLLARHFVTAFKRDPREGYARGFYEFLQEVGDEDEFLQRIRPNSDKSGAAMRACPVGVFSSVGTVVERAKVQAQITHNTPTGTDAAVVAALMAHYGLYQIGPKAELGRFLVSLVPGPWEGQWCGMVGARGIDSVHAALTAVIANNRMSSILRACVNYGGDTDTVAAIALGAASCYQEIEQDLSGRLYDDLENGPYGRDFLIKLDSALMGAASVG
jgi:ADP-ribosyl-[dinitrogen reductase] hydrolase